MKMMQNILVITRIVIIILYLIINLIDTALICLWVCVNDKLDEGRVYMHFFSQEQSFFTLIILVFGFFNQTEYVLIAIFMSIYWSSNSMN